MEFTEIAAVGYLSQLVAFALLTVIFLRLRKERPPFAYLAGACAVSAFSGGVYLAQNLGVTATNFILASAEWARYFSWALALVVLIREVDTERRVEEFVLRRGILIALAVFLVIGGYIGVKHESVFLALAGTGVVLLAATVIVLAEQLLRNIPLGGMSSARIVCAVLIVMSGYDIILYLGTISSGVPSSVLGAARGFVNSLIALPLLVSDKRAIVDRPADFSRTVSLYPHSLVAVVTVLALWAIAEFSISVLGENWNSVLLVIFIMMLVLGSLVLLLSTVLRARARVMLTKIFFRYKYDYRKEWLRFIGVLSASSLEHVPKTAIRAVAPIVNSPGGIVWTQKDAGDDYLPVGAWNAETSSIPPIKADANVVKFLSQWQWIIDLNEYQKQPHRYENLVLDEWFNEQRDFWLIVPLLIGTHLLGFIVLLKPRDVPTLNFEDHDLLRTVGRHVGTHIRQAESDKRLAESSQFGAYHRMSAFLMHDLNNLIAQQSLVVKNAEKFRHDPKFVDDTIDTIARSVERMRGLMSQLSRDSARQVVAKVPIHDAIKRAVDRSALRSPRPTLSLNAGDAYLYADYERLTGIFEHLIKNAQDATSSDGSIQVATRLENEDVCISITDSGCGMTPEFVSERLFRPFDSTKGSESMGIGAYQAREYTRMLGGHFEVISELGKGTTFIMRFPNTATS